MSRDSHDPKLKCHYKLYCKVLSNVILEAKHNNYNNQILRSNNKIKTTWETVKVGKRINENNNISIQEINVDGDSTDNPQVIDSVFNEYLLSVAEKTLPQDNDDLLLLIIIIIVIIMGLIISRISIVAPLIVIHHTIWLMPLTAPF
jgi:hypothetical protein